MNRAPTIPNSSSEPNRTVDLVNPTASRNTSSFMSPLTPAPSPFNIHRHLPPSKASSPSPSQPSPGSFRGGSPQYGCPGFNPIRSKKSANPTMLEIVDMCSRFSQMDGDGQRALLSDLLDMCDTRLLAYVHEYATPRLKRDPFMVLPNELCLRILSFIDDPRSLALASQVSKRWHEVMQDDLTWKSLIERHAYRRPFHEIRQVGPKEPEILNVQPPSPPLPPPASLSSASPTVGATSTISLPPIDSNALPDPVDDAGVLHYSPRLHFPVGGKTKRKPRSYLQYFKRKYMTEVAWRKGGTLTTRHVTPDQAVVTCLNMTKKYIIVALDNAKILVFARDGQFLQALRGHQMGVWAMVPWENMLVSGGCDRDVRVWDLETGECIHKMRGHTSTVRCLQMRSERIAVSGSRDATLRVWDIINGKQKAVLMGHSASVRCLAIHGDTVVSGSYDTTARIWNIPKGKCTRVLTGHFSQIYAVAFDGQTVVTGCLDTSVRVWDPKSGMCRAVLQGHSSLVGKLQLSGDTLVTGGSDGSIRVWSISKRTPIHRLAAHDNSVTSLQFDSTRIISGGSDGRVKVWDLHTGMLVRELGQSADAVWCVSFEEDKAVAMVTRYGKTYMEIWSFAPPGSEDEEETVTDDESEQEDSLEEDGRLSPTNIPKTLPIRKGCGNGSPSSSFGISFGENILPTVSNPLLAVTRSNNARMLATRVAAPARNPDELSTAELAIRVGGTPTSTTQAGSSAAHGNHVMNPLGITAPAHASSSNPTNGSNNDAAASEFDMQDVFYSAGNPSNEDQGPSEPAVAAATRTTNTS